MQIHLITIVIMNILEQDLFLERALVYFLTFALGFVFAGSNHEQL